MRGQWCYFHNVFNSSECEKIIQDGLSIQGQSAGLGVEGVKATSSFRSSTNRFLSFNDPRFEWVFDRIWKYAIPANREWFNFNINQLNYIQLAEYDSNRNDHYARHMDVFWMNKDPIFHRKLTCVVQLSDPNTYEGCDFKLWGVEQEPVPEEIRKQGTAIFIPSFVEHQAMPITKGIRYSLAAWIDGPKFV